MLKFKNRFDLDLSRFSLVWLVVMSLFPLALLLLKFNRGRLPRTPNTSLPIVVLALIVVPIVFTGNVVVDPITAGYVLMRHFPIVTLSSWLARYFFSFTTVVAAFFSFTQNKTQFLLWLYWFYDQLPSLHRWSMTESWGPTLINLIVAFKRQPVCILVKTDEVSIYIRHYLDLTPIFPDWFSVPDDAVCAQQWRNSMC